MDDGSGTRVALEADLLRTLTLTSKNVAMVTPALQASRSLVRVNFEELTSSPAIAHALQICAALPVLSTVHVQLERADISLMQAVGDILAKAPSLTDLWLGFNEFGNSDSSILPLCALRNPRL